MKDLTKEQIDKAIEESSKEITSKIHRDFLIATDKKIPEKLKENPLAYHEIAIATACSNTIVVMKETLYKLLLN